jgi:hypothetical protein
MKTQFEQALEQAKLGQLRTPKVSSANGNIDYFGYQLAVHKFNLGIMASGMTCRGIKFTDIKTYYGLKGRSAKECLPQFIELFENYKATLNQQ